MADRFIVIYSPHNTPSLIVEEVARRTRCEVKCCYTPEQTLTVSRMVNPFLVILLSITPIISGSGFIAKLHRITKPCPKILVIAWQQSEQTILSLLEEGIDQYMTFPICLSRLYGKISSLLNEC